MAFANDRSGIYSITNTVNEKRYVGSAANFGRRWRGHVHQLRHGKHHSAALQRAWNKYGADAFEFDVVEFVDRSRLIEREQVWLDFFKPRYNVARVAGSNLGCVGHRPTLKARAANSAAKKGNAWNLGRIPSSETRAKISAALAGRKIRLGHKATVETRAKMSAAHTGRVLSPEHRAAMSAAQLRRYERERSARLLMSDGTPSQNQSHAEYYHRDGTPAPAGYEAERGE